MLDDDDVHPDPNVDLGDLDRDTLRELRSLGLTGNRVGKHLLTAAAVVDSDPAEALRQLRAAVRRGARLPVVRETAGVVAYAAGDFALALRELRTATRLGVGAHLLPLMVDCERALGRPDRALDLAAGATGLDADTAAELAIVVSGIHRDAGNPSAALQALTLATAGLSAPAEVRLRYARAEALLAAGDQDAAGGLFGEVARDDTGGVTDAAERVAAAYGLTFDDVAEDDPGEDDPAEGAAAGADDLAEDDARAWVAEVVETRSPEGDHRAEKVDEVDEGGAGVDPADRLGSEPVGPDNGRDD